MSLLDDLDATNALHLTPCIRLRAAQSANPYNPRATANDWTKPDELAFSGALAASSSTRTPDGLDTATTTRAVLTVFDPSTDIRVGDRIRAEPDDGTLWQVTGVPARDLNPFTGWQPTLEIQLEEVKGT
ncbi:hypothetical protein CQR55_1051 [Bifidobacterium pseudolongum subsp. globosum]|uniref:hypothetical protein n=1 Tax=Bifidobacterium pseudolongum TaxID=1694 RepID=UPI000C70CB20|nr:hypothetical protein [Bifidobacterium pseudolongum]PKU96716.1 hypothetical protein CQR55_1051 [Bifidobacterium pseudolongum subsp. globosum]